MTAEATDRPLYQVKDWDAHFEGAKSKTYNNKTSCTMPTKHGLGYKRLVKRKDGGALFGAWCALIQILSRHPKPRQGYCTDTGRIDGIPYDPSDLECLADIPAKHFKSVYEICSSQVVGWLMVISEGIPQGYHKDSKYPLNSNSNSNLDSNLDSNTNPKDTPPKRLSFGEFRNVKLTDEEYNKLCDKRNRATVDAGIEVLGAWLRSTGKKRKCHYACLNDSSWVWEKVGGNGNGQNGTEEVRSIFDED